MNQCVHLTSVFMSKACITPDDSVGNHDRYETESSDKHLGLIP